MFSASSPVISYLKHSVLIRLTFTQFSKYFLLVFWHVSNPRWGTLLYYPTFSLLLCCAVLSHSVVSDSETPWTSLPGSLVHGEPPGKNSGEGCHAFLQGIFPIQGQSPSLLHCRWILYQLNYQGSPLSSCLRI